MSLFAKKPGLRDYSPRNPDLSKQQYLTKTLDGHYICAICHAPIDDHTQQKKAAGVYCHYGCLMMVGMVKRKEGGYAVGQQVDMLRDIARERQVGAYAPI